MIPPSHFSLLKMRGQQLWAGNSFFGFGLKKVGTIGSKVDGAEKESPSTSLLSLTLFQSFQSDRHHDHHATLLLKRNFKLKKEKMILPRPIYLRTFFLFMRRYLAHLESSWGSKPHLNTTLHMHFRSSLVMDLGILQLIFITFYI